VSKLDSILLKGADAETDAETDAEDGYFSLKLNFNFFSF